MMWVFFTAFLEAEFAFCESRSAHGASHSFFFPLSVQSGRRGHILVHYSKGFSQRCHLWKSGYFIYVSDVFRPVSDQVMACHRASFVLSMKETTLGSWLSSTTLPAPPPLSCERTTVTSCELTKRTSTGFWGWVSLCHLKWSGHGCPLLEKVWRCINNISNLNGANHTDISSGIFSLILTIISRFIIVVEILH